MKAYWDEYCCFGGEEGQPVAVALLVRQPPRKRHEKRPIRQRHHLKFGIWTDEEVIVASSNPSDQSSARYNTLWSNNYISNPKSYSRYHALRWNRKI
jgi:hypothetical protein|eukprot:scaffold845_cov199-Alexandrium_tamarense.AAC.10